MEFTGAVLLLKRNIYPQTGNYGFTMDCSVDATTGKYFFGLSGNGNDIQFTMESGKILFDNKFVHSYSSNVAFSISTDFTNSKINLRKDDAALLYGNSKPTGYFEYFYFKRERPTMGATFDVNISGDSIPLYSITNKGYLLSSGQGAVTGYFINNSIFPARIFNSTISAANDFSFAKLQNSIVGGATGNFAYSGDYTTINFSQPISTTFNTNFGDINILFTITDLRAANAFVLLQDMDVFALDSSGNLNKNVSYTNYSGGHASTGYKAQLAFVLDYVSGSGIFTAFGGVTAGTGIGYGNFLKSGLATGTMYTITGNFPASVFTWATGFVSGFFTGVGEGVASGIGYTGYATGVITGYYQDYIYDGSGTFTNSYPIGVATNAAVATQGGLYSYATGYLDVNTLTSGNNFLYRVQTGTPAQLVGQDYQNTLYCEYVSQDNVLYTGYPYGYPNELWCQFAHGTGLSTFINSRPELLLSATCDASENIVRFTATLSGTIGNAYCFAGGSATSIPYTGRGGTELFKGGDEQNKYYATGFLDFGNAAVGSLIRVATPSGITGSLYNPPTVYYYDYWNLLLERTTSRAASGLFFESAFQTRLKYYVPNSPPSTLTSGNITGFQQIAWALSGYADKILGVSQAEFYKGYTGWLGVVQTAPYTGGYYFPLRAKNHGNIGTFILLSGAASQVTTLLGKGVGFFNKTGQDAAFDGTPVVPYGHYTGLYPLILTGSGSYEKLMTQAGSVFYKSFTGAWSMQTGIDLTSLYDMPLTSNSAGTRMVGSGNFQPNSFMNFKLHHIISGTNSDSTIFTISGNLVSNPISGILNMPNT